MTKVRSSRITRIILASAMAGLVGVAALTSPAAALPPAGDDTPLPPPRADLKVYSLSVAQAGSFWNVAYTIANSGTGSASPSTVSISNPAGGTLARSVPSLAAGARYSSSLQMARSAQCYDAIVARADSSNVIAESNETNNTRDTVGVVPPCPPRYTVRATSFTATDESGVDGFGSDEIYWIFDTVSNGGTSASGSSNVYTGIDTGDVQSFSAYDNCYWGCVYGGSQAPVGIGLNVELWEQDPGGNRLQILRDIGDAFAAAGGIVNAVDADFWPGRVASAMDDATDLIATWAEDDHLGTSTFSYSVDYLNSQLPSRGMSFNDTRIFRETDSNYSLNITVTRVV
jgi:hypothetical protein